MSNKFFLALLFLLEAININISNCTFNFQNLLLEDKSLEILYIMYPESFFHLSLDSNLTLPKYIRILVKPTYYGDIINNYIISYYGEDITFSNRTQFSITNQE